MGQAAAFLNGLVKGYDTASRWKREKREDDQQEKAIAEKDRLTEQEKKRQAEIAAIDTMQGPKDDLAAEQAELEQKRQAAQKQGMVGASTAKTLQAPAGGLPGSVVKTPSFAGNDVYAKPEPAAPASVIMQTGIPKQEEKKPEMRQPTIGDMLNYRMRVLDVNRRYGKDVSGELIELANLQKKAESEGLTHAMGMFSGGHYEDGIKAFNSVGKTRWKLDPDSKPTEGTALINGQRYPTKIVTLVNQDGQKRVINTANDMHAMMRLEESMKFGMEGRKQDETERHNKATEDISKSNAEAKLATADAKEKSGGNTRLLVNDGVKQLDAAYGVRRDPISNMVDPDSIKDKAGYYRDSAIMEQRVRAGENPMTVAAELADAGRRKQEISGVAAPSAKNSGSQYSGPAPWRQ